MARLAPGSPTFCRPQQLDRERLRHVLDAREFADVRYHEVVVVVDGPSRSFQLLAVGLRALHFITGVGGLALRRTRVVRAGAIARVGRVTPDASRARGLVLHGASELFELVTGPGTLLHVATFEPASRAFFFVERAATAAFQRKILRPPAIIPVTAGDDDPTSQLLEGLLTELSVATDAPTRVELLDELATAATCNPPLQRLCLQDASALTGLPMPKGPVTPASAGLVPFLVDELTRLPGQRPHGEATLAYLGAMLRALACVLFAGHGLPERLHAFLQRGLSDWLTVATTAAIVERPKSEHARVLLEDMLDAQAALFLDLCELQTEAAFADANYVDREPPIASLLALDATAAAGRCWPARLLKRIAVISSRMPRELEDKGFAGSLRSLALWRNVSTLLEIVRGPHGQRLASKLLQLRLDYVDLYLRQDATFDALAHCSVPHVTDAAAKLRVLVDMLLQARECMA